MTSKDVELREEPLAGAGAEHPVPTAGLCGRVDQLMRAGEVVETGPTGALFAHPEHPYTQMLLAAEPEGTKAPVPAGAGAGR